MVKFRYTLYLIYGIFKHMPNEFVSGPHLILANLLAMVCFYVYYMACKTEPGEVTKANAAGYIKKYKEYYDG